MNLEFGNYDLVDLSTPIYAGMPVYPGDPEVELKVVHDYADHTWRLSRLSLGTHTGTHVDACSHMHEGREDLDRIPLGSFLGLAQKVDLEANWPENRGLIFAQLAGLPVLEKLLQTKPPFVCGEIDQDLERALLAAGIVTYTNLTNYQALPLAEDVFFIGLPLKIKEGDGSPVRAVALVAKS